MQRFKVMAAKSAGLLFFVLTVAGCSPATTVRNDPLIGRIFEAKSGAELPYKALFERISNSDVIYLGENHDNAEHHRIQQQIIRDLLKAGKKPQLGFEFFSVDQTGFLRAYVNAHAGGIHKFPEEILEKRLRQELGWQDRTDREWRFYFGFLKLAREHRLSVFGADLPAGIIRSISRNGISALTPVESRLIQPTGFSDDDYRELMFNTFRASHCGFAMKSLQEKMYETWIARNDTMARSISDMHAAVPNQPLVVILGGGHTEHDMGVYERVSHLSPGIRQLNIGLQEIFIHPAPLTAYLQPQTINHRQFPPSHQYLWFTQRNSYRDPCKQFRKHLSRMKKAESQ